LNASGIAADGDQQVALIVTQRKTAVSGAQRVAVKTIEGQ
jgi:hypothetical protein